MDWIINMISITLIVTMALLTAKNMFERKMLKDYVNRIEDGIKNLENLIDEGESIIEEINRFWEHAVTRIDVKNKEIWTSVRKMDEKVGETERRIRLLKVEANRIQSDLREGLVRSKLYSRNNPVENTRRVIPISSRYGDVLRLAANGYSDTEIAKKLGMGKGEIMLVLNLTSR